jgi:hypothetical protein
MIRPAAKLQRARWRGSTGPAVHADRGRVTRDNCRSHDSDYRMPIRRTTPAPVAPAVVAASLAVAGGGLLICGSGRRPGLRGSPRGPGAPARGQHVYLLRPSHQTGPQRHQRSSRRALRNPGLDITVPERGNGLPSAANHLLD